MDREVDLILQHGWAHDAQVWHDVAAMARQILGDRVKIELPDRGYLGPGKTLTLGARESDRDRARATAVICHSFGLHLIEESVLRAAELVVIVSGFLTIHQARAQARSKRAIAKMRQGLVSSAEDEIAAFHGKCGAGKRDPGGLWQVGQETSVEQLALINQPLLSADLEWLDRSRFDTGKISPRARVVIVHGTGDQVIPLRAARDLHDAIAESVLIEVPGGGHALPLSHPQVCLSPVLELCGRLPRLLSPGGFAPDRAAFRGGSASEVMKP